MAELAPQLEELKKKYGNDRNKMAQAQMELYKQNKVNMFGGCLPLILQLVIMIAFYQALTGSLATNPLQLQQLAHRAIPALVPLIPIDSQFLWMDLGLPDQTPIVMFLLPALVVITTYLQQKLMATPTIDPSQAAMTRQMNLIMPMMFGLFALQFASGLSIYFIVSNLVGTAQSWLMNRRWKKTPLLTEAGAGSAKSTKTSKPVAALPEKSSSSRKGSTPLKTTTGSGKKGSTPLKVESGGSGKKDSTPVKTGPDDSSKQDPTALQADSDDISI
jgi:YidC/Oxa1 family membrane protein insertase